MTRRHEHGDEEHDERDEELDEHDEALDEDDEDEDDAVDEFDVGASDAGAAPGDAERREGRRAAREARQASREARREARRAARASRSFQFRSGPGGGFFTDAGRMGVGQFARAFVGEFVGDVGGESYTDTVESRFTFERAPRLRVRNVSGETTITAAGAPREIKVVARKRVTAGSEDRAKRLLQNLEVRMEKRGDELVIEPHLYEQERGWIDLFRGKRFRVDFDITVPAECAIDAQTVSGELTVEGVRGPLEVQTVSGDLRIEDVQGPMRLRSVSGDVDCRRYAGHFEGNTVSGDVTITGASLRSSQLHTVSGDVQIEGRLDPRKEHRFKTISGDVELALSNADLTVDFRTASGDVESQSPARVIRRGRKEYGVVVGGGHGRVSVKTVSGDLTIRATTAEMPSDAAAADETVPSADVEATQPMDTSAREEIRAVLERLAKGELGVDDAASALDDAARRGR
ncbi:MAG TPA: DUF4097 family beta strand repeat-containing protein [Candidatus Limnocylindria bacterium]|nr:DUF4097 family beta strand repeat-containing protein [Candidatus Limnocylindria bacterium]